MATISRIAALSWARSATAADSAKVLAWAMLNTPVNSGAVALQWAWLTSGPETATAIIWSQMVAGPGVSSEITWGDGLSREINKALVWAVWSAGPPATKILSWGPAAAIDLTRSIIWAVWSAGPQRANEIIWNPGVNLDLPRDLIWQTYSARNIALTLAWASAAALDHQRQLLWNSFSQANISRALRWEVNSLINKTTSLIWWGQFAGICNMNTITLKRVSDNLALEIESFSLNLARDSWCWNFSAATRDAAVCTALDPETSGPVEVELDANGTTWRFIVESISAGRDFSSGRTWQIQGRSPAAVLAAPYDLPVTSAWTTAKNARQIVQEVLSGSGFSETWNITDWTIPAGALAVENMTKIEILALIAKATGAVIQVDPVAATLDFSYYYPVSPADFASSGTVIKWFAEDFEISGAWQWEPAPGFNYVIASGRDQGVMVHVKRSGTDFANIADPIIDPLIAVEIVGRERGRQLLDKNGYNRRIYTLKTPFPIPGTGPDLVVPGDLAGVVDPDSGSWKAPVRAIAIAGSLRDGCWLTATLEKVLV